MDLVLMTVYPVKFKTIVKLIKENANAVRDFSHLYRILKYVNPVIKLVQDVRIKITIRV
jgi:hypothetical protein